MLIYIYLQFYKSATTRIEKKVQIKIVHMISVNKFKFGKILLTGQYNAYELQEYDRDLIFCNWNNNDILLILSYIY